MASPSKDVLDLVAIGGFGTFKTNLFYARVLDKPDNLICFFDIGEFKSSDAQVGESYPLVQILLRVDKTTGYDVAFSKMRAIRNYLTGHGAVTVDGTRYAGFWVYSDITFIGYDTGERKNFVMVLRMICDI